MSYVQQSLLKDETVEYQANVSPWAFAPRILFALIILIIGMNAGEAFILFFLVALLILGVAFVQYKTTELALTNKRIVAKFGFIKRETMELKLDKVESVQLGQGVLGRILGFGDVIVSGAGNPKAPIPYISNPMQFRTRVFEIQDELEEKTKAGNPA